MGVIGSIINGVGSLAGNILGFFANRETNKANRQINNQNNDFNEAMMEKQMAYNTEMWHKQNDYNDPRSQIQRYKNAGINPAAVLGSFNAGNAQSANGVSAAQASSSAPQQAFRPDTSGIEMAGRMIYEKRKQDAEIKHLEMDTIRQEIENRTSNQEAIARIDEMKQRTKSSQMRDWLDNQRLQLQREQMSMDWAKHRSQMRSEALQAEGIVLDNIAKEINNINLPTVIKVSLSQQLADIAYKDAQRKYTDQQVKHEIEKVVETRLRAADIRYSINQKEEIHREVLRAYRLSNKENSAIFDDKLKAMQQEYRYSGTKHKLLREINMDWKD